MSGFAAATLAWLVITQVPAPPFPERVPVVVEVTDELAPDELTPLRRLGAVTPRVVTRSNMLPVGLLDAISRFPSSQVVVHLPLVKAHVEQFEGRLGIAVIVDLAGASTKTPGAVRSGIGPLDDAAIAQIQHLGPRRVAIRVDAPNDELERELARLGPVEVRVEAKGRSLEGAEIERLLHLYRARRVVHVSSDATDEAIRGLAVLKPLAVVFDAAPDARFDSTVRGALADLGVPVTFRFVRIPTREQIEHLLEATHGTLELPPDNGAELNPDLVELLRSLGPTEIESSP